MVCDLSRSCGEWPNRHTPRQTTYQSLRGLNHRRLESDALKTVVHKLSVWNVADQSPCQLILSFVIKSRMCCIVSLHIIPTAIMIRFVLATGSAEIKILKICLTVVSWSTNVRLLCAHIRNTGLPPGSLDLSRDLATLQKLCFCSFLLTWKVNGLKFLTRSVEQRWASCDVVM